MVFEPRDSSVRIGKEDSTRYFAIQPIYSKSLEVIAYEALCRSGPLDHFHGDGDAASRIMIDNQLLFGYEGLSQRLPVFLNCTHQTLHSGLLTLLPTWIGIEILESVVFDEATIAVCHRLKSLGYIISLDDFEENAHPLQAIHKIYEFADFIKIDLRTSIAQIPEGLRQNSNRKRIMTIAEKIESKSEFEQAVKAGFELFQGRYLSSPVVHSRSTHNVDTSRLRILFDHLDLELFSDRELEQAVACVPSLVSRVLRRTSWLIGGESSQISLHQAIQLLGRSELRMLIALYLSCIEEYGLLGEE